VQVSTRSVHFVLTNSNSVLHIHKKCPIMLPFIKQNHKRPKYSLQLIKLQTQYVNYFIYYNTYCIVITGTVTTSCRRLASNVWPRLHRFRTQYHAATALLCSQLWSRSSPQLPVLAQICKSEFNIVFRLFLCCKIYNKTLICNLKVQNSSGGWWGGAASPKKNSTGLKNGIKWSEKIHTFFFCQQKFFKYFWKF
jgi:hypothetical protein